MPIAIPPIVPTIENEDNSIAAGATEVHTQISLPYIFNGTLWVRQQGTADGKTKVASFSEALTRYSIGIPIYHSGAVAVNSTIFAMRNPLAATKSVYIEEIFLTFGFDAATPLIRTSVGYYLVRFSAATPTGGLALTPEKLDSSDAATSITDARVLSTGTGLTTAGVTFSTAVISYLGLPAVSGAVESFKFAGAAIKLAPGEGFAIRLAAASIAGQSLSGNMYWSER